MRLTLVLLLFAGAEAIPTKEQLSLGPSQLETQGGGQHHPEPGMESSGHSSTTTLSDELEATSDEIMMEEHDTPLDLVVTPDGVTPTHTAYAQPGKLDWDKLRPDQYENIPFLKTLRQELERK